MQTETIKLNIIRQIMEMDDSAQLTLVEQAIKQIGVKNDLLGKLAKPMRKKLDIEQLKKEQNYHPIEKKAFFQKIDQLQIEESIEELLAMI